jgi:hypothetical protein
MLFKADILFDERYQKYYNWFETWLSSIYITPSSLSYRKDNDQSIQKDTIFIEKLETKPQTTIKKSFKNKFIDWMTF